MNNKLAGFSYIYNAVKFDIPFIESIKSVIDVVDQFVLTVCESEDNTKEIAEDLFLQYPKKIKLVYSDWVKHFTEISKLANFTTLYIDEDISYMFQLQSDEVIHENSLEELVHCPERMRETRKTAASWKYHHFLGGPEITFPFCYTSAVRIAQRDQNWHVIGDGVQLAYPGDRIPGNLVLDTNIEVFHYGKMKDPLKGFQKEVSFQNLFVDIGFPDPKMKVMLDTLGKEHCDYVYLFRDHVINKTISKFTGTHPVAMKERLEKFKALGYEQLVSAVEQSLKIEKESL